MQIFYSLFSEYSLITHAALRDTFRIKKTCELVTLFQYLIFNV